MCEGVAIYDDERSRIGKKLVILGLQRVINLSPIFGER